jgi:AhpD family alkylhydroperoxidase
MNSKKELQRAQGWMKEFGKTNPDSMRSFQNMMEAVEKEHVLSAKTKELIAIATAITEQCEWCIAFHVNNALKVGATKEEIREAAWVAVLMGGGPALMHAGLVLEALEDLA